MRALLVGGAPQEGACGLLRSHAPSFDVIIGVDSGAEVLLQSGIRVDVVVGDLDSLSPDHTDALTSHGVAVKRYPRDKDESDLDLALQVARTMGATSVAVTAAFAERLDHTLASVGSVMNAADLTPDILEPSLTGWVLHARYRSEIALREIDATFSVFSVGEPAVVSCDGVRWPLDHRRLEPLSTLGLSNVVTAESATVKVHEGSVLVLQPSMGNTAEV